MSHGIAVAGKKIKRKLWYKTRTKMLDLLHDLITRKKFNCYIVPEENLNNVNSKQCEML